MSVSLRFKVSLKKKKIPDAKTIKNIKNSNANCLDPNIKQGQQSAHHAFIMLCKTPDSNTVLRAKWLRTGNHELKGRLTSMVNQFQALTITAHG